MTRSIISVFTKPWAEEPLPQLADKLAEVGVDAVELVVRPGYQVTPDTIGTNLKDAVRTFDDRGLRITSIASDAHEATIAACGAAGVPLIRIMAPIDMRAGYAPSIQGYQRQFDDLVPLLERHGVTIGVQNHHGFFVGSAVGLLHLLWKYQPRHVCAVLDMAHCALEGEPTAMAVDIVKDRLHGQVNFKSAYRERVSAPEDHAIFNVRWTTHQHGCYSWREFAECLKAAHFSGTYCLPAEYTDPAGKPQRMGDDVLPYLRSDLAHLRSLMAD